MVTTGFDCVITSVIITPVCYTQPISMSEEPNAVIDCYLAISLDSLVFIYEHSKVYVFNDIPLYLLYLQDLICICISSVRTCAVLSIYI